MTSPAQSLLLEYLSPASDARILVLEGGDGWLAAQAARLVPDGEVLSLGRDVREIWAAQALLESIPNASTNFEVFPVEAAWDIALLSIPKERRYARSLLIAAWEALKPGGRLMLAGPGKSGAKAVINDAARLFGNAAVLGYRDHQRAAACLRGETLADPLPVEFRQPGVAPGTQHFSEIQRPQGMLKLETHPGIFSWEALDEGTALLLDHFEIKPGERVWDVGCGYGAIGLSAALAGAGSIAMSDVNLLALQYAQKNVKSNGLENQVQVFPADGLNYNQYSPLSTPRYDLIISNPAFHQGYQVERSMAEDLMMSTPDFLSPSGRLVLVANRFLNYDKFMRDYFGRVAKLTETNKFHVIEARIAP